MPNSDSKLFSLLDKIASKIGALSMSSILFAVDHDADGTHKLDTDGTLAANSDTKIASQKAVKTYADNTWTAYSDVVPTRASADDPTYVLTFAGVDLTSKIGVGMRVKFTQNSATVYGIVTAIAFSTNTTLTIYGGTDYDVLDTATYPITAFHFSGIKAPFGFPLNPLKWRITGGTNGSQVSPTINTWYNIGGNIVLPIGVWDVMYTANVYETHSSGDSEVDVTLGTTTSNSMDDAFRRANYTATNALTSFVTAIKHVSVSSKTTIYRNMMSTRATTTQFWIDLGGGGTESIVAVCAYL